MEKEGHNSWHDSGRNSSQDIVISNCIERRFPEYIVFIALITESVHEIDDHYNEPKNTDSNAAKERYL